jgi:hypothetical protein
MSTALAPNPILERYRRAFAEAVARPADPDELPGVVLVVHVDDREVTHVDRVDGRLLDAEVRRVQAEATGEGAAFAIAWHEGREDQFAQCALLEGRVFLVEIHDDATPPGHCLAQEGVSADDAIAIIRGWLAKGSADGEWQVTDWR